MPFPVTLPRSVPPWAGVSVGGDPVPARRRDHPLVVEAEAGDVLEVRARGRLRRLLVLADGTTESLDDEEDDVRTPAGFAAARRRLGLSVPEAAHLLAVDARTIRRWEADPESGVQARAPSPTAARVMRWLLEGFRPPEFPRR